MRVVFSAGRYDRPLVRLAASVDRLQEIAGVIIHTEQAGQRVARWRLFTAALWPFFYPAGPGRAELVVQWAPRIQVAGEPRTYRLTALWYQRVGGARTPPFHAAAVPLVDRADTPPGRVTVVIAAHLPTRNNLRRRAVWRGCMRGLVRVVGQVRDQYPGCAVVVACDFNVDHRTGQPGRALVGRYLTPLGLRDGWQGREPAVAGTHGRRLIDAAWTDLPVAGCQLVADDDSSDHRPFRLETR